MKEEEATPGTLYPLLGKLLCFLPEHLKKKLCCVTPLIQSVSKDGHTLVSKQSTKIHLLEKKLSSSLVLQQDVGVQVKSWLQLIKMVYLISSFLLLVCFFLWYFLKTTPYMERDENDQCYWSDANMLPPSTNRSNYIFVKLLLLLRRAEWFKIAIIFNQYCDFYGDFPLH